MPPVPRTWADLLGEDEGVLRSQWALSVSVHAAARARWYEDLSLHRRAGLAACHGHGAAAWLSALATPGLTGTAIHGEAMRAAVRLWLGAPPRSVRAGAFCRCGAWVGADWWHFFGTCEVQTGRHNDLQNHAVRLLAAALRRSGLWADVAEERGLAGARALLRPDLTATCRTTGVQVWGDESFISPSQDELPDRVVAEPLRTVAADERERTKVRKYTPSLPVSTPPHAFTPVVWEACGRVGPMTAAWLRTALSVPGGRLLASPS
eukprot:TRINITY_DN4290_c0_g1_i3.p2 TRINITY_DN4290_c0_g1~~TRINITY_DN4290_c0_g1_i3.p2  ORF type:complete len:264 (-),score=32.34 TRINITY_DN4290_c0_g1_i3:411-1202(-)